MAEGPAQHEGWRWRVHSWALGEECHNYTTVVEAGSSPPPCSQRNRLCTVMRHSTLFPREKPALLKLVQLLRGY